MISGFIVLVCAVIGALAGGHGDYEGGYAHEAEPIYAPQPYSFGYDTVDEWGNKQFRQEQSDHNNVKTGSYGYTDANGIYRRVEYIADEHGFRATIKTNEPGTAPGHSADATYHADPVDVKPAVVKAAAAVVAPAYAYADQGYGGGHGYADQGYQGGHGYADQGYHNGHSGHHGYKK